MKTYHVDFFVNGEEYELDVPANKTALNVIRDMLDLTGAKEGCGAGECGACAMIVDGVLINGCLMLAPEMDGKHFETVEGFADEKGNLSPIQQSFIDQRSSINDYICFFKISLSSYRNQINRSRSCSYKMYH